MSPKRICGQKLHEELVDEAVVSVDLWLDDPSDSVNLTVVTTLSPVHAVPEA